MHSENLSPILSRLVLVSSVIWFLGCNSGTNNTMIGASKANSKAPDTDSSNDEVPGPQTEPPFAQPTETSKVNDTASVTVQVVDRAGFDAVLAKHKGHVVLVDYWATWCAPCRKKFPHTVALANAHAIDGLAVIGVAMDDDEAHGDVVDFLSKQQATFENLRSTSGASDESFEAFEIPGGTLPCLRLFDRDGQILKTFAIDLDADKQFTDEEIAEAVIAALKQ